MSAPALLVPRLQARVAPPTLGTNGNGPSLPENPLTLSVAPPPAARSRGASGIGLALLALLSAGCSSIAPGLQFKPNQLEARSTP